MIEYRDITLQDIPELVAMTLRFLDGSPTYRHIPRDEDKICMMFENAVYSPDVFCRLAFSDDKLIGGMIGAAFEYYFSRERMAGDIAIFIEPEFRNSRIAVKLVDSFGKWATSVGCREVTIGATTQSHGSGYERLLNRLGYETVGFVTKKQTER